MQWLWGLIFFFYKNSLFMDNCNTKIFNTAITWEWFVAGGLI